MTSMNMLYMLLVIIVGAWVIFTIWYVRHPAPRFARPVLAFVCEPTDDQEITCFFCGRPFVELEFTYRTHDRTVTAGVHQECLNNPRHLALTVTDLRALVR